MYKTPKKEQYRYRGTTIQKEKQQEKDHIKITTYSGGNTKEIPSPHPKEREKKRR
jgi:hypothetical protein